jgi:hypothetical protein
VVFFTQKGNSMFDIDKRVRVTKVEDGVKKYVYNGQPRPDLYSEGEIYLGYWTEGKLMALPQEGCSFRVLRDKKNGQDAVGIFISSEVKDVYEGENSFIVETANSTYLISYADANKTKAAS